MPAVRGFTTVQTPDSYPRTEHHSPNDFEFLPEPFQQSRPGPAVRPAKRKRTSNAFFLYRSHIIAHKLLPPGITHQNDVSREVAAMWRAEPHEGRTRFFRMAEEAKLKRELEMAAGIEPVERKRVRPPSKRVREKARAAAEAISASSGSIKSAEMLSPDYESSRSASPALTYASSSSSSRDGTPATPVPLTLSFDMSTEFQKADFSFSPPSHIPFQSSPPQYPSDFNEVDPDLCFFYPTPDSNTFAPEWSASFPTSSLSLKPAAVLQEGMDDNFGSYTDLLASMDTISAYSDFIHAAALSTSFEPVSFPFDNYNWPTSDSTF